MYTDVVVGIDGTDAGRDAAAVAQILAPSATQLALVHVRVLELPARGGTGGGRGAQTRERSLHLLEVERERSAPAAETISVLAPDVGTGLRDAAESRGADLLVVGSCHRSAVGRILAGDDTRAALHRAPCAVAITPRGDLNPGRRLALIGVAYDGSPQSKLALAHARGLAEVTGATLRVRRVVVPRAYGTVRMSGVIIEDPDEVLARERERLGDLGDATLEVVIGTTGEQLATFSEEVDVLICGSRRNGIVKRVALGSTSDYLARHCACPLIVTPAVVPGQSPTLDPEPSAAA
jgi:nucleotide-binding universal stress UspA family protein